MIICTQITFAKCFTCPDHPHVSFSKHFQTLFFKMYQVKHIVPSLNINKLSIQEGTVYSLE